MGQIAQTKPRLTLKPTGKTAHYAEGRRVDGIVRLEIEDDEGRGFYRFHYDRSDRQVVDTWHETLDDAFEQARFEYGIGPDDWVR